jgi:hypothetical protein
MAAMGGLGGSTDVSEFQENLWEDGGSGKYLGMVNTRLISIIFGVYYPRDYPLMCFAHTTDNTAYKSLNMDYKQPGIPDNYG